MIFLYNWSAFIVTSQLYESTRLAPCLTIFVFQFCAACYILWPFLWFWHPWCNNRVDWGTETGWDPLSELYQDIQCKQWRICSSSWWFTSNETWAVWLESFKGEPFGRELAEVRWQRIRLPSLVETII